MVLQEQQENAKMAAEAAQKAARAAQLAAAENGGKPPVQKKVCSNFPELLLLYSLTSFNLVSFSSKFLKDFSQFRKLLLFFQLGFRISAPIHDMHHLTLHHGPSSRLVASDVLTDFTSLTTNELLGLQETL